MGKLVPTVGEYVHGYVYNEAKNVKEELILDIGCGIGFYTRAFCRNDNIIVGLDLQNVFNLGNDGHSLLSPLGDRFSFRFVRGDGTQLPFTNDCFDRVISFDVIEHVQNDELFVRNAFRVLKPGGTLILGTPNLHRLINQVRRVKFPRLLAHDPLLGDIYHLREYSTGQLHTCLFRAGFNVQQTILLGSGIHPNLGYPILPSSLRHYILVSARKGDPGSSFGLSIKSCLTDY